MHCTYNVEFSFTEFIKSDGYFYGNLILKLCENLAIFNIKTAANRDKLCPTDFMSIDVIPSGILLIIIPEKFHVIFL